MKAGPFPSLPLDEWESTKITLHLYVQIVGKIRMALMPTQNHWWHVPLYVTVRGLGTGAIPYGDRHFNIDFNFCDHKLTVETSRGQKGSFSLHDELAVSDFYRQLFDILDTFSIDVNIRARPYDLPFNTPFAEDDDHRHYDTEYISRYWHILLHTDRMFRTFNSTFYGKTCPVQLYWHSFDLAVTRFSGRKAPPNPTAGLVEREAYSHEVISFGFWPGDMEMREPAFYSYTFPAPEGLDRTPLQPLAAYWVSRNGSPLALLSYDSFRTTDDPEKTLLNFLESTYLAGARSAGWEEDELRRQLQIR